MADATAQPVRTPIHVWIVGIIALIWNAGGAYAYLMTQTENAGYMAQLTPEQVEYYAQFPAWATSVWAIAVWGSVLGSILLLLRSRWAEPVFLVALVGVVVNTIRTTVVGGWQIMGGAGPIAFSVSIVVIALGLWLYARVMKARGVLR